MSAVRTFSMLNSGSSGAGGLWKKRGTNEIEPLLPLFQNVYCPNNLTVVNTITITSDERLKVNIEDIPNSSLDKLMQIQPKQYNFKNDDEKLLRYGFIAQEVEKLFPSLVSTPEDPESPKTVNYLDIIPLLLLKIQDLQEQIDDLKK